MHKIITAEVGDDYRIALTFEDGVAGTVDLTHLVGRGVFRSWKDYSTFRRVLIGETGDLRWPDGVDLCPDSMYLKVTGKAPEGVFPELKGTPSHA